MFVAVLSMDSKTVKVLNEHGSRHGIKLNDTIQSMHFDTIDFWFLFNLKFSLSFNSINNPVTFLINKTLKNYLK